VPVPLPADSDRLVWANLIAKQRLRWTVPVTQPMLLCSQVQRAGGTLLARLFDGHPACFAHPFELQWGWPRKFHWPNIDLAAGLSVEELYVLLRERWPRKSVKRGFEKSSKAVHRTDPDEIERLPFLYDPILQRDVFGAAIAARPPRVQRDLLNAYLTSLFNAWLDYQNLYRQPKQWVTAFLARLIMQPDGPERFFADYPDGLLVTIVREPGEWLVSYTRHMEIDDHQAAIGNWMLSAEAGVRAHAARPDRVVVILFEDLVQRTESVMRLLCTRMDLAFDPVLLEPTYNTMPIDSDSSFVSLKGIDRSVGERNRKLLTPAQQAAVAPAAAPLFADIRRRFALFPPRDR
jgi:hypothetical protein